MHSLATQSLPLATVFVASLLGSFHCVGMCGGFVAFYSGHPRSSLLTHALYNGGRLTMYMALGAAAAFAGAAVNHAGELLGLQRVAAVALGILMIGFGLFGLFGVKLRPVFLETGSKTGRLLRAPLRAALAAYGGRPHGMALTLGLISAFLPCGWLYMYVAMAAASAQPVSGALIMAVFWLGGLPAMLALGGLTRTVSDRVRRYLPRISACLLIAAGVFSMSGHFELIRGTPDSGPAAGPSCHGNHHNQHKGM